MWSIGVYSGASPFALAPPDGGKNPVLTRENVDDVTARFVADPFMLRRSGVWYMFFEVLNDKTEKGEIGLAMSHNGLDFMYQQIVLAEAFHLSYPCIFQWNGEFYMVPETLGAAAVCLYQAKSFPSVWTCLGQLMQGSYADPSIFRFDDKWWILACSTPYQHDELRLFFAEKLLGAWQEHPASPIVQSNRRDARPAGRVITANGKLIRFAQDCTPRYGAQVRAFEISQLTTRSYVEEPYSSNPILAASGSGWNALGMHHLDPHLVDGRWIACVDGFSGDWLISSTFPNRKLGTAHISEDERTR